MAEKVIKENKVSKNDEVVEIPIGKYFSAFRNNPWILATIVLGVLLVVVLLLNSGKSITGNVISEDAAGQKLVSFINAQGTGEATLVSAQRQGALYSVVVSFNGQDVPVYVTLDGNYLVTDPISLSGTGAIDNTNIDSDVGKSPIEVDLGNSPVKGQANAPVTIVEFSDYECPFCGRFYSETSKLIDQNYIKTGKVKLVFKDFPLSFHQNAQKAAEAARCVGDQQGHAGYFKMHDKLFENQQSLSIENYKKWATELKVNSATFSSCLDSGKFASAVQADLAYGSQLGVSGTPGFFINGVMVEGAQPYSVFEQLIEAELAKLGTA